MNSRERFLEKVKKAEFYNSEEFKQAEIDRREALKPKEHVKLGSNRVYCPDKDKITSYWWDAQEHGDYIPGIDDGEPSGAYYKSHREEFDGR